MATQTQHIEYSREARVCALLFAAQAAATLARAGAIPIDDPTADDPALGTGRLLVQRWTWPEGHRCPPPA